MTNNTHVPTNPMSATNKIPNLAGVNPLFDRSVRCAVMVVDSSSVRMSLAVMACNKWKTTPRGCQSESTMPERGW